MDAPAMFTRKQVPEDVVLRNTGADEGETGAQEQLHRDEKEHKPVLKKVKEKVKKIKSTLTGNSNGRGDEYGHDERADDKGSSNDEEEGDAAVEREAALEKGGYMEDVEDKPVASEPDPEVHGAPMYESERAPAVQDLVAKYDPQVRDPPATREAHGADAPGVRFADLSGHDVHESAAQEARRDESPKVRLGDLGGPVVEDPAAPRSTTPAAREGEDIGTTPVVQEFESMTLSDAPAHVGAAKQGAPAESKDVTTDNVGGATYTDKLKNLAAVPAEYGRKMASTAYQKVAGGGGTAVDAGTRDDERTEAMPVSGASAGGEEWKDAPAERSSGPGYTDKVKATAAGTTEYGKQLASAAYDKAAAVAPGTRPQVGSGKPEEGRDDEAMQQSDVGAEERKEAAAATDAMDSASGPGYTEKIKSAAVGTTEYGKKLASTAYEKVAGGGGGTAGGAGKRDDEHTEAMPVSDAGAGGEEWKDVPADVDAATDRPSDPGYTDRSKATAAGTTEYGKQLASTAYDKVTAVAPSNRPQVGAGKPEEGRDEEAMQKNIGAEETKEAAAATDAKDRPSGQGYTEKIKSAAAGTTEYGKQLASTAYEKAAGVGTAVVGKVQQATQSSGTATPGVGAQQQDTSASTGNMAEKLRPGDEDRSLSSAISSAVQQRKEEVGGTVGQRVPSPGQVITKAREVVTSLTGGNRVSETVQPNAAAGADVKENVGAEAPVLRGEEIGEPKPNTNTV